MVLRCRSVVARAALREEQPSPGLRISVLHHAHDTPWLGVEHFHMTEERRGAREHDAPASLVYLFEDSRGAMLARVDGGAHERLAAGGVFWLEGGAGASCTLAPEHAGAACHGLRVTFQLGGSDRRAVALTAADIPEIDARGARVRVLVGDALGARSPLAGPLTVLDVHLAPGAEVAHVAPREHDAWAIAIVGDGFAGPSDSEKRLEQASAVAFAHDGDSLRLRAGPHGLHVIVAHAPGDLRKRERLAPPVQLTRG